jgi:hypothetical protein
VSRRKDLAARVVRGGIVHAVWGFAQVDFDFGEAKGKTRARRKAWRAQALRRAANPMVLLLCDESGGFTFLLCLPRTDKPVSCMACIAAGCA